MPRIHPASRLGILASASMICGLAQAAEPAWWTQQKAQCGLPAGTAYNTWIGQGSPCKSGAATPSLGGSQQQMMYNATNSILQMMIQQQQEDEARERAAQAAKAAKEAELIRQQDARLEEVRQRLQGAIGNGNSLSFKGTDDGASSLRLKSDSDMLASAKDELKDAVGDQHPEMDSYVVGQRDAADCKPQRAGAYCAPAAKQYRAQCVTNYRNGYKIGETTANSTLEMAYSQGKQDKQAGKTKLARAPQRITGKCGAYWIESYTNGFNGAPDFVARTFGNEPRQARK